ncbi:hypothetical protein C6502_04825 [Candidatus Poribacteria bacterium]|nr:MAG: hypothetical protein C6502_04825 [Candidatus Poribacteria bacterium]
MTNAKTFQILVLIALFLAVGSQTVSAQIAQEAHAIFEKSCFSCHGSGAPFAAVLLIEDHSALIEKGAVVPGDPDASELYKRLLAEGGALMPLGGPPLPDGEIETVKNWISAGAPDWATHPPSISHTVSGMPIHPGDRFTVNINAETAFDVAKWQLDIAFDPAALEAVGVSEGDLLQMGGGTTTFQGGTIDNAVGSVTGISAERQGDQGVTGTGNLLQVGFRTISSGETKVTLQNLQFNASAGWSVPVDPYEISLTVEEQVVAGDVNGDRQVNILDLVFVAQQLGKSVPAASPADVNGDGVVNILDLVEVARHFSNTAAPPSTMIAAESVDPAAIEAWIAEAQLEDDGSLVFKQGIANLQNLLASLIPAETALHRNYPNPFNPETWIPYQLATPAEVALTIYDINGGLVRHIALGYQAAGVYQNRSRAVYWDGRNQYGESVVSGLYFYTLIAGEFSATRRMLILK